MTEAVIQATATPIAQPIATPVPTSVVPTTQWEFTPEKERQALKLIMTDSTFVTKWIGRLQPEHFTHDWSRLVFRAVSGFFKKYGHLPAYDSLVNLVRSGCTLSDPTHEIMTHLRQVASETPNDVKFIKDVVLEHMRQHDYRHFAMEFAGAVRDREYDRISEGIKKIILRHGTTDPPQEYLETSVAERVRLEDSMMHTVPSPWPTLNVNHGGGFEASAVSVFMGPSGSGKSVMLVNTGAEFLKKGKTVYHFTFELSETMTKARYDVCITGFSHKERKANPAGVDDWLRKRRANAEPLGKLYVIEKPTGTCTMNDVMAAIEEQKILSHSTPDVIILDYLTIMAPNDRESVKMDDNYSKLKVIAEEARAMAMMLRLPVITAVQSNRGSIEKETIKKQDIADSYAVIHVVDLVLTINQRDEEKSAGKTRLYVSKSRNHKDEYSIVCDVDYDRLQVKEDDLMTKNYNATIFAKRADPRTIESGTKKPIGETDPTTTATINRLHDPQSAEMSLINNIPDGTLPFKRQTLEAPAPVAPMPPTIVAPVVAEPVATPTPLNITVISGPQTPG